MQPTTLPHQARCRNTPATQSRGTVLVVDDENGVREMTQKVLEKDGFKVIAAANAQQALALFIKHTTNQLNNISSAGIDAAVIDLSMPDMHGLDLAAKLRSQAPNMPIVAISGYDPLDFEDHDCRSSVNVFLQKPFRLAELRTQINKLLELAPAVPAP
jgi:CheY-like chemotaxis protein